MAKILIADDLGALRKSVRFLLKMNKYDVVEAANGKDALKKLEQEDVDLIIIDLRMPIMDGAQAIKEIRKIDKYKDTPIFLYSAFTKTDSTTEIKEMITEMLDKPVETNLLLELIEKHLN